jgi:ribosomal-protein-alanine N-acetyltransferase
MFETERLILRTIDERDVDEIHRMRSDSEVMRFIRNPQNREESINWIKLVSSRWETEKIGFCALIEKNTKEFVGWCGIWRLKETGELEIGYAIGRKFWGKGLATEAAQEFLQYGFEKLKPEKIVAVAQPENAGSRRVMEKLGMQYDYTGEFYNRPLVHYSITREEFSNRCRECSKGLTAV